MFDFIKNRLRPIWYKLARPGQPVFECPICGKTGPFKSKRLSKNPPVKRRHSKCLSCGAVERHRMLHLVLRELLVNRESRAGSVLHVAPERCMRKLLASSFDRYETLDLFMDDVDHKEDLQHTTLADATYDFVVLSRVLTAPPDLNACLAEIHRVLKPKGFAVISESLLHETTTARLDGRRSRARELGLDFIDLLKARFRHIDLFLPDRYDAKHQLNNIIDTDQQYAADYPELVDIPGIGYKEIVLVCGT